MRLTDFESFLHLLETNSVAKSVCLPVLWVTETIIFLSRQKSVKKDSEAEAGKCLKIWKRSQVYVFFRTSASIGDKQFNGGFGTDVGESSLVNKNIPKQVPNELFCTSVLFTIEVYL